MISCDFRISDFYYLHPRLLRILGVRNLSTTMHTSGMANESEQKHSDAVNSDKSNDLEGSQKSQIGALNVQHRVSGPEASTLNETKVTKTEPSKGQNSPNNQFPQSVAAADAANTDRDTDLVDDDDAATNMQMDTGGGKKKNKRKPKSQRGKVVLSDMVQSSTLIDT